MYGILFLASQEGNPSLAQIQATFDGLVAKFDQSAYDAGGRVTLAGVTLGVDAHGNPILADATLLVAIAANLNQQRRDAVQQRVDATAPFAGVEFLARRTTSAELEVRLRQRAGEIGCERVWVARPGDGTATADQAALLAKFGPV